MCSYASSVTFKYKKSYSLMIGFQPCPTASSWIAFISKVNNCHEKSISCVKKDKKINMDPALEWEAQSLFWSEKNSFLHIFQFPVPSLKPKWRFPFHSSNHSSIKTNSPDYISGNQPFSYL